MMNEIIIVTTFKCSACKCIENIIKNIQKEHNKFKCYTLDFKEVPEWIANNIELTDFPTTIFIRDGIIKYHFVGTLPKKTIVKIIDDINF